MKSTLLLSSLEAALVELYTLFILCRTAKYLRKNVWILIYFNMSWKPNPDAMPFQPTNAYYTIKLPCCQNAWKIRKKGLIGRCVQWTLVFILFITVVVNVLFIMDTTSKFRKQQLLNPKGEDKRFEERRHVIIGMY